MTQPPTSPKIDPHPYSFPLDGGEMGALIRRYDWSKNVLGPAAGWPLSLRTLVQMMLTSRFPMLIFWGPELITFYNDAFRPSLGNNGKHPSSLGQRGEESWAESWPVIGPMIYSILGGGEAVWFEDQKLPIYRDGQMGYAYWTYSFSALTDDTGAVGGVLVTCSETTQAVESQQRLAASEGFTRTLLANSPVASLVFTGSDMVIHTINEAMLTLMGRDTSIIGQPFMQAMPELRDTPLLERLRQVLATGQTYYQSEERFELIRYGQPYTGYYNYIYSVLPGLPGEPDSVVVTAIEVTGQVLARRRIEQSQGQLLALFEQSPVGIAIISEDALTFQMVNSFYSQLVGRRPEDLISKPLLEAMPEIQGQGFDQLLWQVIHTGVPFIANEVAVDLVRGGKQETIYVDLAYQPRHEADGRVSGVFVITTDVTQQVRSRRAVEASENRLRSIIASAPAAMGLFVGRDLVVELPNQPFIDIVGKGPAIEGKPLREVMPELITENQPFLQILDDVYTSGNMFQSFGAQVRIVQHGVMTDNYYNITYTPLRNAQGEVFAILDIAIDVTEQIKAQQALEQSEARFRQLSAELEQQVQLRTAELQATVGDLRRSNDNLAQFAYIASHDLQEPLRKIQQFGDLIKTQYADDLGEGAGYLERMQMAASRMSTLIRDLLAFSRISTQQNTTASVPLRKVVEGALTDLELLIQESGAVIEQENLPTVPGDATQLGQLFSNLLSNALKFRRTGLRPFIGMTCQTVAAAELLPTVRPTRPSATYYRIDVVDNGIGFDEKYVDRIFQVFQRLHGRGEYVGTGIGLAICQKVVANHGGAITATSQPGQGATFSVYLPMNA